MSNLPGGAVMNCTPFEEEDAELGRLVAWVCNRAFPTADRASRFLKHVHGVYLDLRESGAYLHPKVGRNDPCSCGSGLKAKRCCKDVC